MSSVFNTSTMKSPPLVDCDTGSFGGGMVSTEASFGPGTAALTFARGASEIGILAATGVVSAAAPASVAPLRKARRAVSGELLRFGMVTLQNLRWLPDCSASVHVLREFCALSGGRQEGGIEAGANRRHGLAASMCHAALAIACSSRR